MEEIHCIACGIKFTTPIVSLTGVLCRDCANQGLFRKQIIITGITRMHQGHVCVSGVDPQTWKFVRPVFGRGQLARDFVMEGKTQVIRHFNLVEMEFIRYDPSRQYHTEDWIINEHFAPRFVKHLSDNEILAILTRMSITNLKEAIESKSRSLFIVKAHKILRIWHEQWERFKVRITFIDHAGNIHQNIPVTDLLTLSFIRYQLQHGKGNYNRGIRNIFNNNPYRFVRVGLTRPAFGQPYWMQVTALITIPDLFNNHSFSYYEDKIGSQA